MMRMIRYLSFVLVFMMTLVGCSSKPDVMSIGADCTEPLAVIGADNSIVVQKRYDACETYLENGKEKTSADVWFYQGRLLFFSGLTERALEKFEAADQAGSTLATLALGYLASIDTYKSDRNYLDYYRSAAEDGDEVAKVVYALELAALSDEVTLEDNETAWRLLREASASGFPPADFFLGVFYNFPGPGDKRNKAKAIEYYRSAAKGGVREAVEMLQILGVNVKPYLAEQYPYPEVVPQDLILNRR